MYEYSRYFNQHLKGHFLFGDITKTPKEPGLVKSRPVNNQNTNSIVLKWNKIRHFTFISKDDLPYTKKKDQLVFRAKVHSSQPQRIKFLEKYYGHPLCNIGKIYLGGTALSDFSPWVFPFGAFKPDALRRPPAP